MKKFLSALLVCSSLAAQTTKIANDVKPKGWIPSSQLEKWTMTASLGVGTRSEKQNLNFSSGTTFDFKNLSSVTMNANMVFDFDHIIVRFGGDYGWLVHGTCNAQIFNTIFIQQYPSLSFSSGYNADAQAAIAARVRFWKFQTGSLSFIPALGFEYSHFNLSPANEQIAPLPFNTPGLSTLTFTRPFQQDWFGPVFEGRVALELNRGWRFDLYYQYIHLAFRQTFSLSETLLLYSNGNPLIADQIAIRSSARRDSLRTHLGGADFSYRSPNHWQLGLHFDGSSTWTHIAKAFFQNKRTDFLSQQTTVTRSKQLLDLSWINYRLNFFAAYWF